MTARVRLLGRPRIEADAGAGVEAAAGTGVQADAGTGEQPAPQPRGRKSWALLARVGLAERKLARRELAEELFAGADDPLAALRWSLADVRRSLQLPQLLRGDPLALPLGEVWFDTSALEDGSLPDVELGGVLLDGVELIDCPVFSSWLLTARARCVVRTKAELRERGMRLLAAGDAAQAVGLAGRAARLDPLDEPAQELFLRALVADGQAGLARTQLAACEGNFVREGIAVSAALRAAAQDHRLQPPRGLQAGVIAASLLQAATAALDAGAADGGIETLRRAADDATRAGDLALQAEVLRALGGALVHAVRGLDGEGALVLHRALRAARELDRPALVADLLRELAFVDVQAGRHASARRALDEATRVATGLADPVLTAGVLAVDGMNTADRGQHLAAAALLRQSVAEAEAGARPRQRAWSLGVLARSLLLSGQVPQALRTAEASIAGAREQRWTAFLPWPLAIRAECLAGASRLNEAGVDEARADAEQSFALGCELGDPCWEGMSARMLAMLAWHSGDRDAAWAWILDARRRSDRVTDRYVWISGYIGLTQLEMAAEFDRALVPMLADRLYDFAVGADLPEFQAWALTHRAGPGDAALAEQTAGSVDNPLLHARINSQCGTRHSYADTGRAHGP